MEGKSSSREGLPPKENLFRLLNDKKSAYISGDMQSSKEYQQLNLSSQSSQAPSHQDHGSSRTGNSYPLPFHHESVNENILPDSGTCLDSSTTLNQSHNRPLNSCIPIGQAFPQMLGGITEFRKNLMVTVQTGESSHLHQPAEQLERQRQRNRQRMKNLRLDPEFRAQERLRQRQRMFLKRQDPQFREKERILQRVRVREKRNMIKALESGNGLLERLGTPSGQRNAGNVSDDSSSLSSPNGALVPTSSSASNSGGSNNTGSASGNSGGGPPNQSNGSLTVYGTLVEGSQLGQHLLLPNNFLMPHHNDLHHLHHHHHHHHHALDHQHNGDHNPQECPGLHRGCPGNFNFELCRNNMLPNCKVCMKLYQDLSKHARGHKRNHRCNTCGRVFRLKQHLKGHMKTHGDKNLACPHCPYKTCYNFALNRHLILKHSQGQGHMMRPTSLLPLPPPPQLSPQQQPLDITQSSQMAKCGSEIVS